MSDRSEILALQNQVRILSRALNGIAQWHEGLNVDFSQLDEPTSAAVARNTLMDLYGDDYGIQKAKEAEGSARIVGSSSKEVSDEERLFFEEINNPVIKGSSHLGIEDSPRTGDQAIPRPDPATVVKAVKDGLVRWFGGGAQPPRDSSQGG